MRTFDVSSPELVQSKRGHSTARDYWQLFDNMSELIAAPFTDSDGGISWQGGTREQALSWARNGKPELVSASDVLMARLEEQAEVIVSPSRRVVDDVAGAVPNVQNYIVGLPCAMRRVIRETSNHTPLAVIVDGTISATMSKAQIEQRGACILALVRILSARRAIELWHGVGLDRNGSNANYVYTRLDSAPLDIGRAAFMLCDVSATRVLGYLHCTSNHGQWPYDAGAPDVAQMTAVCKQAFAGYEMLCIPGQHINDKMLSNPIAWVLDKLRQYGERMEEE